MFKRICLVFIFAFLLPLAGYLLGSCSRPCEHQCHYVTSAQLKVLDNAGRLPSDVINSSVIAKALVLRLDLTDTTRPEYCTWKNNPFENIAYAMVAHCEYDRTFFKTDSIKIVSSTDFDPDHPAGANLRDIFYFPDTTIASIAPTADFYLTKEPLDEAVHTFTISFRLDTTDFSVSSQPVKLLRQ